MVRILIVTAVLFAGYAPQLAQAHDLDLLTEVICSYETRGESEPDAARGASDEVGACQVRPGTARLMGFHGSDNLLANPRINRVIAKRYLHYCSRVLRTESITRLAHCYNGGPNLPYEGYGPARRYATAILKRYLAAQRQAVAVVVFPWSRT